MSRPTVRASAWALPIALAVAGGLATGANLPRARADSCGPSEELGSLVLEQVSGPPGDRAREERFWCPGSVALNGEFGDSSALSILGFTCDSGRNVTIELTPQP